MGTNTTIDNIFNEELRLASAPLLLVARALLLSAWAAAHRGQISEAGVGVARRADLIPVAGLDWQAAAAA